jgi:hypothetical protein
MDPAWFPTVAIVLVTVPPSAIVSTPVLLAMLPIVIWDAPAAGVKLEPAPVTIIVPCDPLPAPRLTVELIAVPPFSITTVPTVPAELPTAIVPPLFQVEPWPFTITVPDPPAPPNPPTVDVLLLVKIPPPWIVSMPVLPAVLAMVTSVAVAGTGPSITVAGRVLMVALVVGDGIALVDQLRGLNQLLGSPCAPPTQTCARADGIAASTAAAAVVVIHEYLRA